MSFDLILGDCLEKIKELSAASVDAVVTDPPYFQIMTTTWNGEKHDWDDQWNNFKEYLSWLSSIGTEIKRVLRENGSFYLFADDKRSSFIRIEMEKLGFCLINEVVWVKRNNMTRKGWRNYRCFAPITERILFFGRGESEFELACDGLVSTVFSPLRKYLSEEKDKVGLTLGEVNILVGTASMAGGHYFANSQWCFPTKEHYERMQLTFNVVFKKLKTVEEAGKMNNAELAEVLRQNYEVLRQNYEDLRRYFSPKQDYTDVWITNITNSSEDSIHPTQKPVFLIQRMIESSVKPGGMVLDPFMGSGTTGVACANLGRNFIGIEKDVGYFKIAERRIKSAYAQGKLASGLEKYEAEVARIDKEEARK